MQLSGKQLTTNDDVFHLNLNEDKYFCIVLLLPTVPRTATFSD